ncbi:acetate/propionate family kinase [Litchfieldella rifensis]|uniref:Acetate kinase n=1 Tax=Litchfieldella rifensis TaxID=762643 RepID=A0ABV7LT96_9GAMM
MSLLVLNGGSATLKFALYRRQQVVLRGRIERIGSRPQLVAIVGIGSTLRDIAFTGNDHAAVSSALLDWLEEQDMLDGLEGIAHRIVHGGRDFADPVRLDHTVLARLDTLVPLAPLHQPQALAIVRHLLARYPEVPQIACFDTAFHRTQPWVNQQFALPRTLTEEGILRYGFHGLSYAYITRRLREMLGETAGGRVIVAHLGQGCSLCALRDGRSQATSMGFTALDGLMMGRRCGSLDPGVILYLMQHKGFNAQAVEHLLYHDSGLYGVSGISDDMRDLEASEHPHAQEAIALFVQRVVHEIGAMAAVNGGLDALVFTAGIGEHSQRIRAAICQRLAWLGVALDETANRHHAQRLDNGSGPSLWMIPTDEEEEIATASRTLLSDMTPGSGFST